jgi:sensor histidine kinase YesM
MTVQTNRANGSDGNLLSSTDELMKKYLKFNKHDYLVLGITVYPFALVLCYLLLGDRYFQWPLLGYASITALVIGTFSWVTHIITANLLLNLIPSHTKIVNRILIQLPAYVILTQFGICFMLFAAFNTLHLMDEPLNWANYHPVFFAGLLLNVIATSFHEGTMFFEKWKLSLIETEQLKKMNLQSQLDSLKNQVNPHFLFNSLNCLSSLIYTDADKASEFLDEMSKVYRYLLRSNESELISLASELQFVGSFFHMLKTRYGDGIELDIDVNHDVQEMLIPPLTLQMLVENAVKHNSILKDSPLRISIRSVSDQRLLVNNNIQKKMSKILSNQIGLQNIVAKYELLNHPDVTITHGEQEFSVNLPLIKN